MKRETGAKESGQPFPNWYEQKKKLKEQFWYKNLPSQSAEVLKVLQESWESFFELKKDRRNRKSKAPTVQTKEFQCKVFE